MAFVTLGLAQLGVALAVRAPRRRDTPGNPWLGLAVAVSAVLRIAAVGTLMALGSKVPRGRSHRP
jgi:Ca2+-transporting ATPase